MCDDPIKRAMEKYPDATFIEKPEWINANPAFGDFFAVSFSYGHQEESKDLYLIHKTPLLRFAQDILSRYGS